MKKFLLSIFAIAVTMHSQAQTAIAAGGTTATGTGGSVSFTIGQIAYTTVTGTGGSISEGVQQTYRVSAPTAIEENTISLKAQIFPNPATDVLMLTVENSDFKNLNYQLMDVSGKLLSQDRLNRSATQINVASLPNGSYFVRVLSKSKLLKTFTIVKQK
ncbi:MAG: T9SS type A sorting domain-containing protein [Bacteroidetes bacterium]|nr:T9SS type A sorting domain-containing protein [Bacteroidota bacterium]